MEFGGGDVDRELTRSQVRAALLGEVASPVLLGRFEVLSRLGHGSSGTVFEALDPVRGHRVALKCLGRIDGRAVLRFKREFRVLTGLSHPNLLTLYELFSEPGQWFFSMELVDGARFDLACRPNDALDLARLRASIVQLIHAVQALHRADKLHCDLKSSNVLVTPEGRVVVLDLGLSHELARDLSDESLRAGLIGTPGYLAPEQAAGASPSYASDWYAVGVMLFETLTGRLPFVGHPLAILRQKQIEDAPDPRALCPGLPAAWCDACIGLLRRDADGRWSGEAALACLEERAGEKLRAPRSSTIFVGREPELRRLEASFAQMRAGACQTMLIAGRSGMGKSALLDRFAVQVAEHALVLRGRCYERESLPFKVFDAVVDVLARRLNGSGDAAEALTVRQLTVLSLLFPALGTVRDAHEISFAASNDAREQRNEAFAALKQLLHVVAQRAPLVLLIDDLQWGDADSARMLEHVLGPPDPPPLLFVGAYRSEDEASCDFLRELNAERSSVDLAIERLELGPLERATSIELVRRLTDGAAADADSIVEEAAGVPFFIAELVADSRGKGISARAAQSLSLEQLILQRVAAMPEAAQRLLRVLAIATGPLEYTIAAHAAGIEPSRIGVLRELCAQRLVRTHAQAAGELAESYHDRIRETVAASLKPAELRDLHRAIVQAFERQRIEDPERLWLHRLGAGDSAGAGWSAAEAARSAARQLAFSRSVQLYEKALELLDATEPARQRLHAEYGDSLANAGRGAQAAQAYLKAVPVFADDRAHGLRCKAVQQYLRCGRFEPGLPLARTLLRDVGVTLPASGGTSLVHYLWQRTRLRVRAVTPVVLQHTIASSRARRLDALQSTFHSMMIADTVVGATLQARYLREALDAGHPEHVLRGLMWEVFNLALLGGATNERRAERLMPAIETLATTIATPYSRGMSEFARAARLTWTGRLFRDAHAAAVRAREIFAAYCPGTFWERAIADYLTEICKEWMGYGTDRIAATFRNLRDAADRDDQFMLLLLLLEVPYARCAVDDLDGARAFLDQHEPAIGQAYTGFRHHWVIRSVELAIFDHEARAGLDLIRKEWPSFRRSYLARSAFVRDGWHYFHARCAVAAEAEARSNRSRADAQAAIAPLRAARNVYRAYYDLLSGSLHAADGEHAVAVAALRRGRAIAIECQSRMGELEADYRLAELARDSEALARAQTELRAQGIANPNRWMHAHLPAAR